MPSHQHPEAIQAAIGILCAVTAPPKADSNDRLRAILATEVDWDHAVQTAYDHSLAPLFCARLLACCPDLMSDDLRQAMQVHLDRHRANTGHLNSALLDIIDYLERRGVEAIPFKGPTLAQRAFGDPEIRLFYDLDLLFRDADFDRGVACLIDLGYRFSDECGPLHIAALRHYEGQYYMRHPDTGVSVEPHWALTPTTMAIGMDYAQLWRQSGPVRFLERSVLALAPEHEVLMLCIHAAKEHWRSLKPVADLAGYLNQYPQLDWAGLIDQARRWGCLRILLLGLQLVHTLLDLEIAPACQALIARDKKVKALARDLIGAMNAGNPPPMDPYRVDRYALTLRERRLDQLRCILRTILTPRAKHYESIQLPDGLRWLYLPIKLGMDYVALPIRARLKKR